MSLFFSTSVFAAIFVMFAALQNGTNIGQDNHNSTGSNTTVDEDKENMNTWFNRRTLVLSQTTTTGGGPAEVEDDDAGLHDRRRNLLHDGGEGCYSWSGSIKKDITVSIKHY
jgi:hypothetical protein